MIDRGTQTEPMPTLRDDFTRIAQRAADARRELAVVVRDIERLIRGAKPEPPRSDEANLKDLGPQSLSDCLSSYVREIGDIDVLTDRLKAIRDDLAPSRHAGAAEDPFAPETRPRAARGERYG